MKEERREPSPEKGEGTKSEIAAEPVEAARYLQGGDIEALQGFLPSLQGVVADPVGDVAEAH